MDNLHKSLGESRRKREELTVTEALLRQEVERLACLASCHTKAANEAEANVLQVHGEVLAKAQEKAEAECDLKISEMKLCGLQEDKS